MRSAVVFAAAAVLLTLCGCFTGKSPEMSFYDLGMPAARRGADLRPGSFRNCTPVSLSLQYQTESGRVLIDPYRQWVQSPENMLRCYLMAAFGGDSASTLPVSVVDCSIYEYRIDLSGKTCRLGVEYSLKLRDRPTVSGSFFAAEKFSDESGEAFSRSFSQACEKFADRLSTEIEQAMTAPLPQEEKGATVDKAAAAPRQSATRKQK